jgi:membrane-bound metal-dependent hydrolase YbcI (DUF457 family)
MLGRDHALSGAFAFAALGPTLHVTGSHLAAGVLLTAGAGVLPDIDHPDSTIARCFGFLTEAFAWVVARISGGHRHGTHSLAGITVFTLGALAAGAYQLSGARTGGHPAFSWHMVPAGLYLALLYSAALRALHVGGHHGDLLGIGGAILTCYTGFDLFRIDLGHWHVPMLALATGLGCAAHIAGDELTHGGCPIFWPVSEHEFHLVPRPLQFTTAKIGENWLVFPLLTGGLVLAVWHATGHPLLQRARCAVPVTPWRPSPAPSSPPPASGQALERCARR